MRLILSTILSLGLLSGTALALDAPTGDVVLTVKGRIDNVNGDGVARFDLDMLQALDGREAMVETPWAKTPTKFAGAYLRAVLDAAGARGTRLVVRALNDYSAEIPVEDAYGHDTILADRMNGQSMSVREKGPLMVVYPFDKAPHLYTERYFTRSVWQVREIEVLP